MVKRVYLCGTKDKRGILLKTFKTKQNEKKCKNNRRHLGMGQNNLNVDHKVKTIWWGVKNSSPLQSKIKYMKPVTYIMKPDMEAQNPWGYDKMVLFNITDSAAPKSKKEYFKQKTPLIGGFYFFYMFLY